MRLSEYERAQVLDSPIYKKYAKTGFSSVTLAAILADLDNIVQCDLGSLPLIKFLTQLAQARGYAEELDKLSTIDADIGYIEDKASDQLIYNRAIYGLLNTTHIHSETYRVEQIDITLSGGTISNLELLAAVPGDKHNLLWFNLLWDTPPGTAYNVAFQDEDDTALGCPIYMLPADMGRIIWVYLDTATANKALEVDITGGAGAENLTMNYCYCTWD